MKYALSFVRFLKQGIFIVVSFLVPMVFADGNKRGDMLVSPSKNNTIADSGVTFKDGFFVVVQNYIFGLLGVIAVTVFLILAYRLFSAQGKEEQHKKAWAALIYAAVGLAIVPLAYVLVHIATGFDLRF